jgi:4-hydroxybenzoate polyprenyltransferase
MRPANIVTAVADILAGVAISGFFFLTGIEYSAIVFLILSTIGLYGGGVVMNDVFDAELDALERPERPIPSGLIKKTEATFIGICLLLFGIIMAFQVGVVSGSLALGTAIAALVYDKYGKHHPVFGPLNMGLCRGLNLLLGISILPLMLERVWFVAIVPVIYIAAITMISQGEVHGGRRSTLYFAAILYLIAMASIVYTSFIQGHVLIALLFVGLWGLMVFLPLRRAIAKPEGRMLGRAVKSGVLALILMNAAWASAFGAVYLALIIVLLLPLSIILAKVFAVT